MSEFYHDVEIQETNRLGLKGQAVKVYRVSALTRLNTYFSIEIPESEFTSEAVAEQLGARALALDQIKEG